MKKVTDRYNDDNYSNEWYTPKWLFGLLHEKFNFTLDPASCEAANKGIPYYTKEQDGLKQDWSNERVFCNPPFSLSKEFVEKTLTLTLPSVFLLPCRPETRYWHKWIWPGCSEVFIFNKRISFDLPGGKTSKSPPFATVLIGFNGVEFTDMEHLGVRVKKI